ncbi:UDP-N-acetylenolpyruvoylglucosamine reductase [Pontibacillus halophilus JSM 076056 = DSM 19796]|uniref:UDP-N-acetylenolpyruvoylglucosamine reductase n=1 Tax=Pontibacillus halophilus JSM 076056 = DSM 19796 TaxID=1385510 RepID=A0A0A5GL89_9BACI|nr:UDP-N-acetylmuramate dehydrogenase [Pontibacillus halophilus]KGX91978.1 UDP-N-acetylenolpyruvoylglucosamine reductase [Pontibacillus halophilus JSM 076056 = DSM 19796]
MNTTEVVQVLRELVRAESIKKDEPLSSYTFTRTGGCADIFVMPQSYEDIGEVVKYANEHNIPITLLGNGSNVIVRDGGIRGITIHMGRLKQIYLKDDHTLVAESGARIIDASRFALKHTLTGLEFACGIPGTVGGALYMNAGAYGGEVSDVLQSAIVVTRDGEVKSIPASELELDYRHSAVAEKGYIVVEATFVLKTGTHEEIKSIMDDLTYKRESKQPLEFPSCGSVFKRPPGYFAGKLIQDSDLQGTQIGGVQVSKKHAGFMVNIDKGTASDYIALIKHVQQTVFNKFGVELETEVKIIGEEEPGQLTT